jgi:uncharacterized membrane-anchored protein
MNTITKAFIAVVAAQVLFLLGWAGWHEYILNAGQVVLLETRPVDPRDILRGDYLILNYAISRPPGPSGQIGPKTSPADMKTATGRGVWVVLEPRGQYYAAVKLTPDYPTDLQPNQIAVQGMMNAGGGVAYGIEEFFVPEGKGHLPTHKSLEVEASVSPDHHLNIKHVLVDGKPYP